MPELTTDAPRVRLASLAVLFLALLGLHLAPPEAGLQDAPSWIELTLCLFASGLCCRAAAAAEGLGRAFWAAFSAASLSWGCGVGLSLVDPRWAAPPRGLGPADWLFFAASLAFVAACALRPDRPRGALGVGSDVLILTVLLFHTSVYLALPGISGPLPGQAVRDVRAALMLACAVWLLQGSRGAWRRTYLHLGSAIVLLFAGSAVVFRGIGGSPLHPGLWNLSYTFSFLWIGLVAREHGLPARADDQPHVFAPDWSELRQGTALALAAIAFVPTLGFAAGAAAAAHDGPARLQAGVALLTTLCLAGLLLARQVRMMREAERLHRERESALRESEERFSKAFAASPAAVSLSTLEEGRYLDVNGAYLRLMQREREEVVGHTSLELGFFQDPGQRLRLMQQLREERGVRGAPLTLRRCSGELRDVRVSLELIDLGATRSVLGVAEDVTERLRAEHALLTSERRYRLLFERNLAGVFRTTLAGRILECNHALVQMLGYGSRDELLTLPAWDLYLSHADRAEEMRRLQEAGSLANFEVRLRKKDGAPLWVMANEMLVQHEDEEGAVIEGTLVDITERRNAEAETRRLAQLKTNFLVVASHEMRTPLTILAGYQELLLDAASGLTEPQRRSVEVCHRTVQRLTRTFEDILLALQIAEGRLALRSTWVDLGELARHVVEDLAPFLELRRQQARVEAPHDLGPVWADRDRIHEAVSNLVENAIKFTPDGGAIAVRIDREAGFHRVTVEDTGIGIEAGEIANLGESFYAGANPMHHSSGTYQFMARGSGLGLSIARGCAVAHGGRLVAASQGRGRGAAFSILLPSPDAAEGPGAGRA